MIGSSISIYPNEKLGPVYFQVSISRRRTLYCVPRFPEFCVFYTCIEHLSGYPWRNLTSPDIIRKPEQWDIRGIYIPGDLYSSPAVIRPNTVTLTVSVLVVQFRTLVLHLWMPRVFAHASRGGFRGLTWVPEFMFCISLGCHSKHWMLLVTLIEHA